MGAKVIILFLCVSLAIFTAFVVLKDNKVFNAKQDQTRQQFDSEMKVMMGIKTPKKDAVVEAAQKDEREPLLGNDFDKKFENFDERFKKF